MARNVTANTFIFSVTRSTATGVADVLAGAHDLAGETET
jgi:hypothetical protein